MSKFIVATETILADRYDYLEKKIEKINKRALKLGATPLELEVLDSIFEKDENGTFLYEMLEVRVMGEIPCLDGWSFVSTFQYEDGIVFTRTVPGKTLPDQYLNKTSIGCDHCGRNRRRKDSFLLQHEDGSYKEVGRTCLKDFFGHDPSSFVFMATLSSVLDDDKLTNKRVEIDRTLFDLRGFLSMTARVVREHGWVSRKHADAYNNKMIEKYGEDDGPRISTTSSTVSLNLFPPPKFHPLIVEDEDREMADKVIEYWLNNDPGNNEYANNCRNLARAGKVYYRMCGVAASMVGSYLTNLKRQEERDQQAVEEAKSEWIGNVGERITKSNVEVVRIREVGNQFGIMSIITMKDEDGNIMTWFTNTCPRYTYTDDKGNCYKKPVDEEMTLSEVTFTVKEHNTFRDIKQTVVTRCKIK